MSETKFFYTSAGDDKILVQIPETDEDLAILNEWFDIIRRAVNRRAQNRILERNTREAVAAAMSQGLNPS